MKLNKYIHNGIVAVSVTLFGGIAAVGITAAIVFSKNTSVRPYNSLLTDFSKSNDATDKLALDYYQSNTVSLNYEFGEYRVFGTAWYWGNGKDGTNDISYFATNLHVIDSILKYDSTATSHKYAERFSFIPNTKIYYTTYNNNNSKLLENTKLTKLFLIDKITGLNTLGKPLYSDYAIFQTTTKLPNQKQSNFVDTTEELEYALSDVTKKTYYISGFPYNDSSSGPQWITGKYRWVNNDTYKATEFGWSTEWQNSSSYPSFDNLGYSIDAVPQNKIHFSYARQMTFPGLDIDGGSSGSLLSVWNADAAELQPLGIYWGGQTLKDSSTNPNAPFYGMIDLFYSGTFNYFPGSISYSYDNSKLTATS